MGVSISRNPFHQDSPSLPFETLCLMIKFLCISGLLRSRYLCLSLRILRCIGSVFDHERQCRRFIQYFKFVYIHLNCACRHRRIFCAFRPLPYLAGHGNDIFTPQVMCSFVGSSRNIRAEDHLKYPAPVPQIYKDKAAVVSPPEDPAAQGEVSFQYQIPLYLHNLCREPCVLRIFFSFTEL